MERWTLDFGMPTIIHEVVKDVTCRRCEVYASD